ncbi:MAG: hypothetical protein JST00_15025 [Deltaproteobacteria bacterium]|nr:hypothetical protein [Deltaproteobacteria bacterium]
MWRGLWVRVALAVVPALAFGCAEGVGIDAQESPIDEVGAPNPRVPLGDGFVLGGEVSGLLGSGLVLRSGDETTTISADGRSIIPFTFQRRVAAGSAYRVTVETNPSAPVQRCTVANAEGTANADVKSIRVTCAEGTFTVGGTVRGLTGKLTLQNNGGDSLDVTSTPGPAPTPFTFATRLSSGRDYSVTVSTAPAGLTCEVKSGGKGKIGSADVTDVVVSCSGSQTFDFTGAAASFTVPAGVTELTIEAWGAQGNRNVQSVVGGLGGYATGKLAVAGGDVLRVYVGGGANTGIGANFNGGGAAGTSACAAAQGGAGGGASDVRKAGGTLTDRVIVAGGGGGAGGNRVSDCGRGTGGGGGGGWFGGGGGAGFPGATPGAVPTGGSQTAGGAGGTSSLSASNNGVAGASGVGGAGGTETTSGQAGNNVAIAGGAGGGPTGANGTYAGNFTGQGGAGGSSYVGGVTGGTTTQGVRTGAGQIILRY